MVLNSNFFDKSEDCFLCHRTREGGVVLLKISLGKSKNLI